MMKVVMYLLKEEEEIVLVLIGILIVVIERKKISQFQLRVLCVKIDREVMMFYFYSEKVVDVNCGGVFQNNFRKLVVNSLVILQRF